jgi:hypothetical protein
MMGWIESSKQFINYYESLPKVKRIKRSDSNPKEDRFLLATNIIPPASSQSRGKKFKNTRLAADATTIGPFKVKTLLDFHVVKSKY